MPLYAPVTREFTDIPHSTYAAVCIQIVDLGTQEGEWDGKPKSQRKVSFLWEIPTKLRDDGKPYCKSQWLTLALGPQANLPKIIQAVENRLLSDAELETYDIFTLIGKSALINYGANQNGKSKILGVSPLIDGMPSVKASGAHPILTLSLNPSDFSEDVFDQLSEGIQAVIKKSPEYQALVGNPAFIEEPTPDLPF